MQTYIFRQEIYFKAQKHLAIVIYLLDKYNVDTSNSRNWNLLFAVCNRKIIFSFV